MSLQNRLYLGLKDSDLLQEMMLHTPTSFSKLPEAWSRSFFAFYN